MKLIYCIHSIYNPGGMERVLLNKITYLVNHTDWDIIIVTTDQKNKPSFYPGIFRPSADKPAHRILCL